MKNRAYSLLTIKAVNEDQREITGIATTPETDRMGDIVEPDGAEYKLPIPLLWQHDSSQPIGEVYAAKNTKDGIEIRARVFKATQSPTLIERLNEAWESIKIGLVKGLSIGFNPLEYAFMDGGGIHFQKWEWLELSAVTIPANISGSINSIKSFDAKVRAAMGAKDAAAKTDTPSGASEKKTKPTTVKLTPKEGKNMKPTEQIKQFQNERAAKVAKMEALMKAAGDAGESLNDEQSEEYDTLEAEVAKIDKHLDRLEKLQKAQARTAQPVEIAEDEDEPEKKGASLRGGGPTVFVPKAPKEKFKGQFFTQMVIAKTLAHLNGPGSLPSAIAAHRFKDNPMIGRILKANEVAGGGSGAGEWGAELVQANNLYTGDFIEFLYSKTVFDKIPLREVPANIGIKGQDGQATGYWVGQSKAIPASAADFSNVTLTPLKVAALAVVSNELLRDSTPSAEMLVRDALVEASAQRIDTTLISASAASAGVSPAGLMNGLAAISTSGPDVAGVIADIKALLAPFIAAKNASGLYFVMNPSLATSLSLLRNALDQKAFPDIRMDGGMLEGIPVVTGDNVTASWLALLKPSDIYKIGDLGVQVSVSQEATIEQNSVPTGASDTPTAASATLVNMFQEESTALKVVRPINFAKRRTSAVAYIDDADYGSTASG